MCNLFMFIDELYVCKVAIFMLLQGPEEITPLRANLGRTVLGANTPYARFCKVINGCGYVYIVYSNGSMNVKIFTLFLNLRCKKRSVRSLTSMSLSLSLSLSLCASVYGIISLKRIDRF